MWELFLFQPPSYPESRGALGIRASITAPTIPQEHTYNKCDRTVSRCFRNGSGLLGALKASFLSLETAFLTNRTGAGLRLGTISQTASKQLALSSAAVQHVKYAHTLLICPNSSCISSSAS